MSVSRVTKVITGVLFLSPQLAAASAARCLRRSGWRSGNSVRRRDGSDRFKMFWRSILDVQRAAADHAGGQGDGGRAIAAARTRSRTSMSNGLRT